MSNSPIWWPGYTGCAVTSSAGRPLALGLFRSVALVVCLIRKNVTQDFAGAVFGVSQATVSRRWDLLRPVIGEVLAEVVPDPRQVVGRGTVLVDGTVCPTWDWALWVPRTESLPATCRYSWTRPPSR